MESYFITTGRKGKLFTLREEYNPEHRPEEVWDRHVITLTGSLDSATDKARKKLREFGYSDDRIDEILDIRETETGDITRGEVDHSLLPNGKHTGASIYDDEVDLGYLYWWHNNYLGTISYEKTVGLIREYLIEEGYARLKDSSGELVNDAYVAKMNENAIERIKARRAKREARDRSSHVGTEGESVDVELFVYETRWIENDWGGSTLYKMRDSEGNEFVKFGSINERYVVGFKTRSGDFYELTRDNLLEYFEVKWEEEGEDPYWTVANDWDSEENYFTKLADRILEGDHFPDRAVIRVNADVKEHNEYKGVDQTRIGRVRYPENL